MFSKTHLLASVNTAILRVSIGADFSFRRKEFNRLFCKSAIRVTYIFLIATFTAKATAGFAKLANAFRMPVLAPAVA